jgi:uncharacterized membrane protein YfcA
MMAVLAVLSGIFVGLVQGLIGGGGSVLGAPMLIYVVGLRDPHIAIGTSAIAVSVAALASLASYIRAGHVKWRCGAVFTLTGLIGAIAGSSLGKAFPGEKLMFLFGLLMLVVAAGMALRRPAGGDANVRLDRDSAVRLASWLAICGISVGLLSGFFGIGGGFLAVPGLLMATGMPLVSAIGTSLLSVAAFGLATAANYAASGLVDWGVTAVFLAGGILGGLIGTRLTHSLSTRGHTLSRVFAIIVACVGLFLIVKTKGSM